MKKATGRTDISAGCGSMTGADVCRLEIRFITMTQLHGLRQLARDGIVLIAKGCYMYDQEGQAASSHKNAGIWALAPHSEANNCPFLTLSRVRRLFCSHLRDMHDTDWFGQITWAFVCLLQSI